MFELIEKSTVLAFFVPMPSTFTHSEETRINKELFSSFLTASGYFAANTRFQKRPEELATFVDPVTKCPIQMDFVLTSSQWKNAVREVHTGSKNDLDTDHNPLIGIICAKFSGLRKKPTQVLKNHHIY